MFIEINIRSSQIHYLVRVYNYNNSDPEELRLDKEEVDDLYNTLRKRKLL